MREKKDKASLEKHHEMSPRLLVALDDLERRPEVVLVQGLGLDLPLLRRQNKLFFQETILIELWAEAQYERVRIQSGVARKDDARWLGDARDRRRALPV